MEVNKNNLLAKYTVQISCRSISLQHCVVKRIFSILLIMLLLSATACSPRYDDMPSYLPFDISSGDNKSVGRFKTTFLAEQIDQFYRGTNPGPIGVTTFVNVDDLYATSTFGRILGEQLMSELAMRGFEVIELRHSSALQFLKNEGEFALSREAGAVRRERKLGGVVVGTYVISPDRVYLNTRLLDPSSSMILSAASAEMSKTPEITKLARAGGFPSSLERIPVKHLGLSTLPLNLNPGYVQQQWAQEEALPAMPNPRFESKKLR